MRLLLWLAFVAIIPSSFQQTNSTSTTSESTVTIAPTERPSSPVTLDCPALCPRVYRPVCASFRGRRRTYANFCLMSSDINCARRRGVAGLSKLTYMHICIKRTLIPFLCISNPMKPALIYTLYIEAAVAQEDPDVDVQ